MLDPNRLNRNHVVTVRSKDNKFVVVITDKKGIDRWEISWDKWVREGRKALND